MALDFQREREYYKFMLKRLVKILTKKQLSDSNRELVEAVEQGSAFITKWGEIKTGGQSSDFEKFLTTGGEAYLSALKLMKGEKSPEQKEALRQASLHKLNAELNESGLRFTPTEKEIK